jgi:GNAT superfamily N-acetyltransferase
VEGARPATPADVPRLAELHRMALAEMAELRGGQTFGAREARPLDEAGEFVFMGTIDEVPVGYGVAHQEVLRDGSTLGVITDFYVEPPARGVGVGESLMSALLDTLQRAGCSAVDSYALPGDRATKNFFEGSGFTARLLTMHHRIVTDD